MNKKQLLLALAALGLLGQEEAANAEHVSVRPSVMTNPNIASVEERAAAFSAFSQGEIESLINQRVGVHPQTMQILSQLSELSAIYAEEGRVFIDSSVLPNDLYDDLRESEEIQETAGGDFVLDENFAQALVYSDAFSRIGTPDSRQLNETLRTRLQTTTTPVPSDVLMRMLARAFAG